MSRLCFLEPASGATRLLGLAWHDPKGKTYMKIAKQWKDLKHQARRLMIQACLLDQQQENLSHLEH